MYKKLYINFRFSHNKFFNHRTSLSRFIIVPLPFLIKFISSVGQISGVEKYFQSKQISVRCNLSCHPLLLVNISYIVPLIKMTTLIFLITIFVVFIIKFETTFKLIFSFLNAFNNKILGEETKGIERYYPLHFLLLF